MTSADLRPARTELGAARLATSPAADAPATRRPATFAQTVDGFGSPTRAGPAEPRCDGRVDGRGPRAAGTGDRAPRRLGGVGGAGARDAGAEGDARNRAVVQGDRADVPVS